MSGEKKIITTDNLIVDCVSIGDELQLRVTLEGNMYYRYIDVQSLNWTMKRMLDAIISKSSCS
jgi:hypothetical protein|tara:strand:+ start:5341 stop:5529 length:189 start_codon:yes stop_codon:yes gene_type:complete